MFLTKLHMIRAISSPSSSTIGRATLIFAILITSLRTGGRRRSRIFAAFQDRVRRPPRQAGNASAAGCKSVMAAIVHSPQAMAKRGPMPADVTAPLPAVYKILTFLPIAIKLLHDFNMLGNRLNFRQRVKGIGKHRIRSRHQALLHNLIHSSRGLSPRTAFALSARRNRGRIGGPAGAGHRPRAVKSAGTLGRICSKPRVCDGAKPLSTMWSRSRQR